MRFIHTADWQIGMKAAHVGKAGETVREARLAAARRVVEAAKQHRADFILVAGDTFEHNAVERVLIQKVADILGSFGGPVYILPGNHDPLMPGSVWAHRAWSDHSQISILTQAAPVNVPGGTLHPCPCLEKYSAQDPTSWIRSIDRSGIQIGVAHGTVAGIPEIDERYYPIPSDAATRVGLDYLALGHWHSFASYPDASGAARMAYAGSHEPTKFGERDSGNVVLVEIEDRRAPPRITAISTRILEWKEQFDEVRGAGDLEAIREGIARIATPSSTLLNITLSGILDAKGQDEVTAIIELSTRFLYARLDSTGLHPAPVDASWLTSLPSGILHEAAQILRDAGQSATGEQAAISTRALLELFALSRGEAR